MAAASETKKRAALQPASASKKTAVSNVTRVTKPAKEKRVVGTEDIGNPDKSEVDLSSHRTLEEIDRPDLITVANEDMNSPFVKEYAQDLAFMEDELEITIAATTDKNAEKVVPCSVNGEARRFERGVRYKVKRKFVNALIVAEDGVETIQYKDKEGLDQTKVEKSPSLKYPIQVHHDPAGEVGMRWFEWKCRNPL